jgi:3-oxoacyl-[acyl-carrier protein] reductase
VVVSLPCSASKGTLDRIVLDAARELGPCGITENVINSRATDTGWISGAELADVARWVPLGRRSEPS